VSLRHPLLAGCGVAHGFGLRDSPEPAGLLRPRQVHGAQVARAEACRADPPPRADAVVSRVPGVPVGVVTADCVPVLLAAEDGRAVAAVHAGWRGLALGVVSAGFDALRQEVDGGAIVGVIGPHIGPCCYEVDGPVLDALAQRFGADLDAALHPARPGHARLDLAALVRRDLERAGLAPARVGALRDCCTRCAPQRFHSYRRDGAHAGRLVHFVAAVEA
jgi:purine-nucleoside/S-methyl-5'-thioadenosine phosphorylase / adenosine deaminase